MSLNGMVGVRDKRKMAPFKATILNINYVWKILVTFMFQTSRNALCEKSFQTSFKTRKKKPKTIINRQTLFFF